MDRIRGLFAPKKMADRQEYARLTDGTGGRLDGEEEALSSLLEGETEDEARFSWTEYFIFALIGVAMLWAWYV